MRLMPWNPGSASRLTMVSAAPVGPELASDWRLPRQSSITGTLCAEKTESASALTKRPKAWWTTPQKGPGLSERLDRTARNGSSPRAPSSNRTGTGTAPAILPILPTNEGAPSWTRMRLGRPFPATRPASKATLGDAIQMQCSRRRKAAKRWADGGEIEAGVD